MTTAWLLPIAATVASGLLTYWCCVRPMRRGHYDTTSATHGCCPPPITNSDLDEQIAQARAELSRLRDDTPASPSG
jgi:hypothetical protein